jgi:hypothetical protein
MTAIAVAQVMVHLLHVRRVKNGVPSVHPLKGDEMRALRRLKREAGNTDAQLDESDP